MLHRRQQIGAACDNACAFRRQERSGFIDRGRHGQVKAGEGDVRGPHEGDEKEEKVNEILMEYGGILAEVMRGRGVQVGTAYADQMANEKVVGWMQGRCEWGPRALGNRSILANPSSPDMQEKVNVKIKFREPFRPFAPSIIREDLNEWSQYLALLNKIL